MVNKALIEHLKQIIQVKKFGSIRESIMLQRYNSCSFKSQKSKVLITSANNIFL